MDAGEPTDFEGPLRPQILCLENHQYGQDWGSGESPNVHFSKFLVLLIPSN